ncbi:spore protease YyaC [Microaerobacter geothermalis]|uniref:spore protease YyaC n=1 Tax=Microaerobacter geothermalis TaxID=674972 RepID=UPI001F20F8A8|nr:spore protease YyaC [Microaerobacter geothermalis]MCF6094665.1 spore protease YyaC [Microaerobacter geothermalis]
MNSQRFAKPTSPYQVHFHDENAVELLAKQFFLYLKQKYFMDLVIICIGTDRSTGDALGPLVGSKLKNLLPEHVPLYGTLEQPVHAINLQETMTHIHQKHILPCFIAIDACLGQPENIGKITIAEGPLKPGAGVQKDLPEIGHLHITGVVNVGGFMEYLVLQNTRLHVVMSIADVIASFLYLGITQWSSALFEKQNLHGDKQGIFSQPKQES